MKPATNSRSRKAAADVGLRSVWRVLRAVRHIFCVIFSGIIVNSVLVWRRTKRNEFHRSTAQENSVNQRRFSDGRKYGKRYEKNNIGNLVTSSTSF
jgi:hypothetical protein